MIIRGHMKFMCKAIDAAKAMINMSIELAQKENDDKYYLDFMKLHKLLYLSQCYMLFKHDTPMFKEDITAHYCGPNIDGIDEIPYRFGAKQIRAKFSEGEIWPITPYRVEAISVVLNKYGTQTTDEIVFMVKSTSAYLSVSDKISDLFKPEISLQELKKTGEKLFSNIL